MWSALNYLCKFFISEPGRTFTNNRVNYFTSNYVVSYFASDNFICSLDYYLFPINDFDSFDYGNCLFFISDLDSFDYVNLFLL